MSQAGPYAVKGGDMQDLIIYIFIGSIAGVVMGTIGVGGGAIIIVSLLYLVHFPQKLAQGTTLLIVAAPVTLLAAYNYYRNGFVNLKAAAVIIICFLIFSLIGSQVAVIVPKQILKRMLGAGLILTGFKIIFFEKLSFFYKPNNIANSLILF